MFARPRQKGKKHTKGKRPSSHQKEERKLAGVDIKKKRKKGNVPSLKIKEKTYGRRAVARLVASTVEMKRNESIPNGQSPSLRRNEKEKHTRTQKPPCCVERRYVRVREHEPSYRLPVSRKFRAKVVVSEQGWLSALAGSTWLWDGGWRWRRWQSIRRTEP